MYLGRVSLFYVQIGNNSVLDNTNLHTISISKRVIPFGVTGEKPLPRDPIDFNKQF